MTTRSCWLVPFCVVSMLLTGCGQEDRPVAGQEAKRPTLLADASWPSVVLISIDALRPDHLHCYGYPKDTSPRIDQLADEGTLFEQAISSAPWTLPAHACLFTGLCDSVHGCTDTDRRLHGMHYTLAERLKDTGYATAGFFSSPYLHPTFGLRQGFDVYVGCTSHPELAEQAIAETGTVESEGVWQAMREDVTGPKVVQEVVKWLQQNTRRPFFLFIHLSDPLFDYIPPPPYDTKFDPDYAGNITGRDFASDPRINPDMGKRDLEHVQALYDGEIAWTDENLGKILDELASLNLLDSCIVMLTSGHGTGFFEHGLKGCRNSLFDELIRIPLIMRYPAQIPAGQRQTMQVRMIDLLPTVLDLLNMPLPQLMGQSLKPLFAGGEPAHGLEPAVSELLTLGQEAQSFRVPERKSLWDVRTDTGMVFDLVADPGELAPLRDPQSPTVKRARVDSMWSRDFLKAFRQRHPQSPKSAEISPELLAQLRARWDVPPAEAEKPASQPAPAP